MKEGLDPDMRALIRQLEAERDDHQRQAAPFVAARAALLSRSQDPAAVKSVRDRERGSHKPTRKIPLICPNHHPSTHGVVLHVEDEIDEGTPVTPTIIMDVEPGAAGSAEGPPMAGGSWNFVCGKCGGRTSIREPKLLDAALEALTRSGREYRVKLT